MGQPGRPGPVPPIGDQELVGLIRTVLADSPFAGEGYRYRSAHFLVSIGWLGISDDAAFLGEPETNGCVERWIRTLKEQCLWVELHDTIDELRQAVVGFVESYNTQWLIGRLGHRTPRRPTRTPPRPRQQNQIDIEAVQPSGRCSTPSLWPTTRVSEGLEEPAQF